MTDGEKLRKIGIWAALRVGLIGSGIIAAKIAVFLGAHALRLA